MSKLQNTVAEEIRVLITRNHTTQADVAAVLGMDAGTFSRRLRGHKSFDLDELEALANYFDVPITALIAPQDKGWGMDSHREPFAPASSTSFDMDTEYAPAA